MLIFVYKITNIINKKVYIGQTIRSPKERFQRHIADAIHGKLDTHLSRAIRKYGACNFALEVIDTASDREELNEKEKYWIEHYDSCHMGYNTAPGGWACGGNTYANLDNLNEVRQKLSASKMGGKNPYSKKVLVTDMISGNSMLFHSMQEAADYIGLSSHMQISRRGRGVISKLIMDRYLVKYYDEESVTTTESAGTLQQVG